MKVAEIFSSIHGECNGHHQGRIVTFVRLSGCNLSCYYCDTSDTQSELSGEEWSINEIATKVADLQNNHVCITGGEPLIHKHIDKLLQRLWRAGFKISVETNGTIDITPFFRYVDSFVVDYKTQSTGFNTDMILSNYVGLRPSDVVKVVILDESDLKEAMPMIRDIENTFSQPVIAISPVAESLSTADVYSLMRQYRLHNAVLSLQIHKMIDFL